MPRFILTNTAGRLIGWSAGRRKPDNRALRGAEATATLPIFAARRFRRCAHRAVLKPT